MSKKIMKMSVLAAFSIISGCSIFSKEEPKIQYITTPEYVPVAVSDNTFKPCQKPSPFKNDIPELTNFLATNDEKTLSNISMIKLAKAYANTKNQHIDCYKTLINIKNEQNSIKEEVSRLNKISVEP